MRKFRVLLTIALVVLFAGASFAQDDEGGEKWRNFEVTINAGFDFPMGDLKDWYDTLGAKTGINFGGAGGYYFTNRICVGAYFDYVQFGIEEPVSGLAVSEFHYKMYKLGGYIKYALAGESYWEPFARLRLGANFAKFTTWIGDTGTRLREVSYDPELSGGLDLGVMYYTSEFGGIYLQASYNYERLENTVGNSFGQEFALPYNANYFAISTGVTVFFGSTE